MLAALGLWPLGLGAAAEPTVQQLARDFQGELWREGRLWLGGQPNERAVRTLAAAGLGLIINLRTASEVAGLPFDEPGLAHSLSLRYLPAPVRSPDHLEPRSIQATSAALAAFRGPALIHCRTGVRTKALLAALRKEGLSAG